MSATDDIVSRVRAAVDRARADLLAEQLELETRLAAVRKLLGELPPASPEGDGPGPEDNHGSGHRRKGGPPEGAKSIARKLAIKKVLRSSRGPFTAGDITGAMQLSASDAEYYRVHKALRVMAVDNEVIRRGKPGLYTYELPQNK